MMTSADMAGTMHPLCRLRILRFRGMLSARKMLRDHGVLTDDWMRRRTTSSRGRPGRSVPLYPRDAASLEETHQHQAAHHDDSAQHATDNGDHRRWCYSFVSAEVVKYARMACAKGVRTNMERRTFQDRQDERWTCLLWTPLAVRG